MACDVRRKLLVTQAHLVYSTIVVWLCGKIRQLNACTNIYIHSFLCVHVACVSYVVQLIMLLLLHVTTQVAKGLVLPVCIVVCRELLSSSNGFIMQRSITPYLVSSCFYAIPIFLIPQFVYLHTPGNNIRITSLL